MEKDKQRSREVQTYSNKLGHVNLIQSDQSSSTCLICNNVACSVLLWTKNKYNYYQKFINEIAKTKR